MNLQDPVGSYRFLENPVGSCIGFLPGGGGGRTIFVVKANFN